MGKVTEISRRGFVGSVSPLRHWRPCRFVQWQTLRCRKEEMK
jgi:hypothetical protein